MPSLKGLMPEEMTTDVDCGWGFTARMTFNPQEIADAQERGELNNVEGEDQETLANRICDLVREWDLTGPVPLTDLGKVKEGALIPANEPIPLDPEMVKVFPQPLQIGIVLGLAVAAQPDPIAMQKRSQRRGSTGTSTASS